MTELAIAVANSMERTAYDVISIELFNKENKMSKHTATEEKQRKIALQLGLDPDRLRATGRTE